MTQFWERRRTRKALRRARAEGRHMVGECRRIMKKKRYLIPESASAAVAGAITEVETSGRGDDLDVLREALTRLDEQMEKHLAFARKSALREYAESIGVAVAIAILLRAFVVEAFQIPSESMLPTLQVGDHIFVAKFSYGVTIPFTDRKLVKFDGPERGDVVVFKNPHEPDVDYIKRVVGLPGETVEIRDNQIFIDGNPMPREHQDEPCDSLNEMWVEYFNGKTHQTCFRTGFSEYGGEKWGPQTIPDGHVFVMGDNRDNSNDSRRGLGPVPINLIKGRALVVWWSRAPTDEGLSLRGAAEWFQAIRWRRFFSSIQ